MNKDPMMNKDMKSDMPPPKGDMAKDKKGMGMEMEGMPMGGMNDAPPMPMGGNERRPRMNDPIIRTIWKTASEQCELVWSQFRGYRVRLWVQGRLIVDELTGDADSAIRRGWELRLDWPQLVD